MHAPDSSYAYEPSIPQIVRVHNVAGPLATVAWEQTVPGREYATPIESRTVRLEQGALTVPVRWADKSSAFRFQVLFSGSPGELFGLQWAVQPASSATIGTPRALAAGQVAEVVGALNQRGAAVATVELILDAGRAEWGDPRVYNAGEGGPLEEMERHDDGTDEYLAELHRKVVAGILARERGERIQQHRESMRAVLQRQQQAEEDRLASGDPVVGMSLTEAVAHALPATVRHLLANGADVSAQGHEDRTALHVAAMLTTRDDAMAARRLEVVFLLLAAGADVNARDASGGTALHLALRGVYRVGEVDGELVRALLSAGADPDARNHAGFLPDDLRPEDTFEDSPYGSSADEKREACDQAMGIVRPLLRAARQRHAQARSPRPGVQSLPEEDLTRATLTDEPGSHVAGIGVAPDPCFRYDPAVPMVICLSLEPGASGRVSWQQNVPDRPFGTPMEEQPLASGTAVRIPLRWPTKASVLRINAHLSGAGAATYLVGFALVAEAGEAAAAGAGGSHGHVQQVTGTLNAAGIGSVMTELHYNNGRALWWTSGARNSAQTLLQARAAVAGEDEAAFSAKQEAAGVAKAVADERLAKRLLEDESEREARRARERESEERRQRGEADPSLTLHEAAEQMDAVSLRLLLSRGADVMARDGSGRTALHLATRNLVFLWMATPRQLEAVFLLLAAGADPSARDGRGNSPLHEALGALHHHGTVDLDIVRALLNAGANPDATNAQGLRPQDRPPGVFRHISPGEVSRLAKDVERDDDVLLQLHQLLDAARERR
jgi:ankyrin repeat protein